MDIVIAAAGKGTRLKDLTQDSPKHILPIAGRPFLYYLLDAAVAAQFRRIIVVGEYKIEKLQAAVDAYEPELPVDIIVVNQAGVVPKGYYGSACPLFAVENVVQGDRFVYTMGDHLISSVDLAHMQLSTNELLVAGYEHDNPERYGVLEVTSDYQLQQIVEKPEHPTSRFVNVGLYSMPREVLAEIHKLEPSVRGEYEITDTINALAKTKTVRVVPLTNHWLDLGRPEDIATLEQFVAANNTTAE